VPTGYGDCVHLGEGACFASESCITGFQDGDVVGFCSTPCESDPGCPAAPSGNPTVGCDVAVGVCFLGCGAGETCPDGMECRTVGSLVVCVFSAPCTPTCDGLACGDDGCGGSCGECGEGTVCSEGLCLAGDSCVGRCGSGDGAATCQCDEDCLLRADCCPDVCDAGVCDGLEVCSCVPDCFERVCGYDGCFGTCGDCSEGNVCTESGQCASGASCAGRCETFAAGAACQCDAGCYARGDCCADLCEAGVCDALFICTCVADCTERFCGSDGCFGTCGECLGGQVCSPAAQCVSGDSCTGRCDSYDPAATCQCDGACVTEGDCCADMCDAGVCDSSVACTCVPDCTERVCGSDGCFGTCGDCNPGDVCTGAGQCLSGSSCLGRCDTFDAEAACQCDPDCVPNGDCCADVCDPGVCDGSAACAPPL
jgi:hypothetical protein